MNYDRVSCCFFFCHWRPTSSVYDCVNICRQFRFLEERAPCVYALRLLIISIISCAHIDFFGAELLKSIFQSGVFFSSIFVFFYLKKPIYLFSVIFLFCFIITYSILLHCLGTAVGRINYFHLSLSDFPSILNTFILIPP